MQGSFKYDISRSYVVETPRGNHLRRNRKDLLLTSEKFDVETDVNVDPSPPVAVSEELPTQQRAVEKHYVTRSGLVSKPPSRYVPQFSIIIYLLQILLILRISVCTIVIW